MEPMAIRLSCSKDGDDLQRIWEESFNFKCIPKFPNPYEHGELLVCEVDGRVVGTVGLLTNYNGAKFGISHCGVLKDYRRLGIMRELIRRVLLLTGGASVSVDAWRVCSNEYANLHTILLENGFEKVLDGAVTYLPGVTCSSVTTCAYKEGCTGICYCDIYHRKTSGNYGVRYKGVHDDRLTLSNGYYIDVGEEGKTVSIYGVNEFNLELLEEVAFLMKQIVTCPVYVHIPDSLNVSGLPLKLIVRGFAKYDSRFWCSRSCTKRSGSHCSCAYDLYEVTWVK